MIHDSESWQDGGHENEHSVSCAKDEVEEELEEGEEGEGRGDAGQIGEEEAEWLLEQNAWLLEQLESKDGETLVAKIRCHLTLLCPESRTQQRIIEKQHAVLGSRGWSVCVVIGTLFDGSRRLLGILTWF